MTNSLSTIAENAGYSLSGDLGIVFGIALCFCLIRLSFGYLSVPVMRELFGKDEDLISKATEQSYRFYRYLIASILGLYILYTSSWFTGWWESTKPIVTGHPHLEVFGAYSLVRWYFLAQMGINFQCIVWHVCSDRRSDFWVMTGHHTVATFLIIWSYISLLHRLGLAALVLHDVSDIFVAGCKLAAYLSDSVGGWYRYLAPAALVLMISSWFVTRLLMFPLLVLYPLVTRDFTGASGAVIPAYRTLWMYSLPFVASLLLFHVLWFYLFLQIGMEIMKWQHTDLKKLREQGQLSTAAAAAVEAAGADNSPTGGGSSSSSGGMRDEEEMLPLNPSPI